MKWENGRQSDCEYFKHKLYSFKIGKFGFDAYILKYVPNSFLPWHQDEVKDGKHYRLNISLKGKSRFFIRNGTKNIWSQKFIFFRPDLYEHALRVYNNYCYKLSIGFVYYKK